MVQLPFFVFSQFNDKTAAPFGLKNFFFLLGASSKKEVPILPAYLSELHKLILTTQSIYDILLGSDIYHESQNISKQKVNLPNTFVR